MRITQPFAVEDRSRLSGVRPSVRFLVISSHLTLCYVPVVSESPIGTLCCPHRRNGDVAVDFM
jgi:hypothetical protein